MALSVFSSLFWGQPPPGEPAANQGLPRQTGVGRWFVSECHFQMLGHFGAIVRELAAECAQALRLVGLEAQHQHRGGCLDAHQALPAGYHECIQGETLQCPVRCLRSASMISKLARLADCEV